MPTSLTPARWEEAALLYREPAVGGWYLNPEANPLLPVTLCIAYDLLVKSRGPSTERKGRELGERWGGEGGEEEKENLLNIEQWMRTLLSIGDDFAPSPFLLCPGTKPVSFRMLCAIIAP